MWEYGALVETCIDLWHGSVAPAYEAGQISSTSHLMALAYAGLQQRVDAAWEVKVAPAWHFVREPGTIADRFDQFTVRNWLQKQTPASFLMHNNEEIVAAVELQYAPQEYIPFNKAAQSVRKLSHIAQLGGKAALHLKIDPYSGQVDRTEALPLAEHLLCVYGVITRNGALALSLDHLKRHQAPELFPAYFLHLQGAIKEDRIRFGHVIPASS